MKISQEIEMSLQTGQNSHKPSIIKSKWQPH